MLPSVSEEVRTNHPYFMHDMIRDQPSALHATLALCREQAKDITSYWGGRTQFIHTGCGTSYHAAIASSCLLVALFQKTTAEAVQSFELTRYYRRLDARTVVTAFSHTGNTKTTLDAVRKSKEAGATVIGLTGVKDSGIVREASKSLVVGNGREKSRAHTKSYTSSLFASMYLSTEFMSSQAAHPLAESLLEQLNDAPQYVHELISREREVATLAQDFASRPRHYFFVGSGPNVATALEAALKMKETNYAVAEGMELEQFLHGPWVSLDEHSLLVLIAPKGTSHERYLDLLNACKRLDVPTIALTDDSHVVEAATHPIIMPEISEELSPLTYIVPLQLFSYYTTLKKGMNPDMIRYDVEKYWAARQHIFPPGTH